MQDAHRRLRHIAAAIAVLAVHVAAVRVVLSVHQYFHVLRERPEAHAFHWITLPPAVPEPPKPANKRLPQAAQPKPVTPVERNPPAESNPVPVAPPAAITLPPAVPDAAILGGLRQYFSCSLPNFEKLSQEAKTRCAQRLGELRNEPAPVYVLSDHEQHVRQQLTRALAVKKAPPLLPCFSPKGGLSLLCVIGGVMNGFDLENAPSYADEPNTASQ